MQQNLFEQLKLHLDKKEFTIKAYTIFAVFCWNKLLFDDRITYHNGSTHV